MVYQFEPMTDPCCIFPGTSELESLTSTVREGVPGFRKEVHSQGEDDDCQEDFRSPISATIGLQRELCGVYFASECPSATILWCLSMTAFVLFQVTVWGDYGRIEGKKVFMGVAQIMLDDLNLSNIVIGWYKLFGTTSLVSGPPSLGLSRRSSIASLDSLKL